MPEHPEIADKMVKSTLAACKGNRDTALLLLAHLFAGQRGVGCRLFAQPMAGRRSGLPATFDVGRGKIRFKSGSAHAAS